MLVHQLLEKSAKRHPDKIAVVKEDERVSYRLLDDWATALASHMDAHAITKGDIVALLIENSIEYIVAYYAACKLGAVAAPLDPALKPDGLQYLINDLDPAVIISSHKSERLLKAIHLSRLGFKLLIVKNPKQAWRTSPFQVMPYDEALSNTSVMQGPGAINESDLASIVYTSGSTGKPKGVMLSHRNITSNTDSICQCLSLSLNDIQMVVLPFFYVMGKSLLNTHIAAGGTIIINNRFIYPADVLRQMIDENVTAFSGVPSTYAYLLHRSPLAISRDKLNSLRYCSQAGGHMARSMKLELRKALPQQTQIVIMYGASEATARLTYLDPEHFETKIDAIGKPIPGVTVRLLDQKGREVPTGMEGELVADGPNIMLGYWNDGDSTDVVLDQFGYHTGDMGYRDSEGFLYVNRRKDDILKVGGRRINPTEIEDFLMSTELLIEASVFGLPDEILIHKLCAIVVPKEKDIKLERLMELCAEKLPRHKCPSHIFSARALPKRPSGKINRTRCAEQGLLVLKREKAHRLAG